MYQTPYQYTNRPMTSPNNGIIWVQGLEGAKAYQLIPNSNCALFDSENEGIAYIKTSDEIGMCSLRTLKYEEINPTSTPSIDISNFITRDEFNAFIAEMKKGNKNEQSVSTAKSK